MVPEKLSIMQAKMNVDQVPYILKQLKLIIEVEQKTEKYENITTSSSFCYLGVGQTLDSIQKNKMLARQTDEAVIYQNQEQGV